jgi:integrase
VEAPAFSTAWVDNCTSRQIVRTRAEVRQPMIRKKNRELKALDFHEHAFHPERDDATMLEDRCRRGCVARLLGHASDMLARVGVQDSIVVGTASLCAERRAMCAVAI